MGGDLGVKEGGKQHLQKKNIFLFSLVFLVGNELFLAKKKHVQKTPFEKKRGYVARI